MAIVIASTLLLTIYPRQIGKVLQTIAMVLFIGISIYIGYELAKGTLSFAGSNWELIIIGYSYLALVANVFYILYFIPVTKEHQSFQQRMNDIRAHATDLEKKYIAVNSELWKIVLTLIIFVTLFILDNVNLISSELLVSIVLSFILLVHAPPETSKFTPIKVHERL